MKPEEQNFNWPHSGSHDNHNQNKTYDIHRYSTIGKHCFHNYFISKNIKREFQTQGNIFFTILNLTISPSTAHGILLKVYPYTRSFLLPTWYSDVFLSWHNLMPIAFCWMWFLIYTKIRDKKYHVMVLFILHSWCV